MQNAETVLKVLRERGRRGLPVERLYRQLFNPELYLLAYGRVYANHGAMTPGVTAETADGMSMAKIHAIIADMRAERYRFKPVRRVRIPKKSGGSRPLGIPPWRDKITSEVIRLLLEAYYEPVFSDRSHGFRPGRGCHTALREIQRVWTGTAWFIETDIKDCFGSLDHGVLLGILAERICDQRFLRLVAGMLKAGYLEDFTWGATLSGAPQGSGVSPVLSNVYLDKLDRYVEEELIPRHTRGAARRRNSAYDRLKNQRQRARKAGRREDAADRLARMRRLPSGDPDDPGYRRLRYCRYADDSLFGFAGPKAEAEQIKEELACFLRDELKLEMSPEKTLVTHAATGAARFLGYEITVPASNAKVTGARRSTSRLVRLRLPRDKIKAKAREYTANGKPARRQALVGETDHQIVATYGAEYRGTVQYYLLAGDVSWLHRLRGVMELSMLRTLAAKHHSTVKEMRAKHKVVLDTPHGKRTAFEARIEREGRKPLVARFGGIPLKRDKTAVLADTAPKWEPWKRKELIARLLAGKCELCGAKAQQVSAHQVRNLKALATPEPPPWARQMARMRRKTLILCDTCHAAIHARDGHVNTSVRRAP